ncbi:hypothetical protein L6452_01875 [Arctium lappa]|uniref:Uncharacterized protein n=1 Tax=Arctium lappa TaxID=4217 RepID=A0ACB9FHU4_ARCLA|nr:hypothetical protein L6452_01875 [Arctium lappa]
MNFLHFNRLLHGSSNIRSSFQLCSTPSRVRVSVRSHDPSLTAQKADAYIRELYNQLEIEKAHYDASSITAEQTCSLLEQKYVSLKYEFTMLQSQHSQLNSTFEKRVSELAQIQADKHQVYLQSKFSCPIVGHAQAATNKNTMVDDHRKFIWEEVSYLERWWSDASDAKR